MTNIHLKWLLLKAEPIEHLVTEQGLYTLWGVEGKYLESFTPHDSSKHTKLKIITDLNRLFEYAKEAENPYRFKRPY